MDIIRITEDTHKNYCVSLVVGGSHQLQGCEIDFEMYDTKKMTIIDLSCSEEPFDDRIGEVLRDILDFMEEDCITDGLVNKKELKEKYTTYLHRFLVIQDFLLTGGA